MGLASAWQALSPRSFVPVANSSKLSFHILDIIKLDTVNFGYSVMPELMPGVSFD